MKYLKAFFKTFKESFITLFGVFGGILFMILLSLILYPFSPYISSFLDNPMTEKVAIGLFSILLIWILMLQIYTWIKTKIKEFKYNLIDEE